MSMFEFRHQPDAMSGMFAPGEWNARSPLNRGARGKRGPMKPSGPLGAPTTPSGGITPVGGPSDFGPKPPDGYTPPPTPTGPLGAPTSPSGGITPVPKSVIVQNGVVYQWDPMQQTYVQVTMGR